MTKQGTEPFIKFYNVFSEQDSNYHLSHEELYLYGLLKVYNLIDGRTVTTINILHEVSPIKFLAVDKKSKNRIKDLLLSLRLKGVIAFIDETLGINTTLRIDFPEDLSDPSIGKGVKGFERVSFSVFNSFSKMQYLYIYFTVKRFDNIGGFKASNERWSKILNLSDKRARNLLKEAVNNRIVYKNIGDYKEDKIENRNNQKLQDNNTYKTIPFKLEEKTAMTKREENNAAYEELVEDNDYKDILEENISIFSTYENERGSVYPKVDDYTYFMEIEEELKYRDGSELEKEFLKVARKRMKHMKDNPQFIENWKEAERVFKGIEHEIEPVVTIQTDISKLDMEDVF